MNTPKWFDYSSKSFDELKCINTNARIGFTAFSTSTDPERPHCAALCVQINNGIKVQPIPFMSWKRLYLTIIHPPCASVQRQGFNGRRVTNALKIRFTRY